MRNTFLKYLYEFAKKDERVIAFLADNGLIVFDDFRRDFPDRNFNFGISESAMVAAAAGMASCGLIPYCYTIGNFLAYRSYEFLRNDVCIQNLNVKLAGIGTGLTYSVHGPSHHTTEDIGLLRSLPNLTVFSPASVREMEWVSQQSYEIEGPVYIRISNNNREFLEDNGKYQLGIPAIIKKGGELLIITTGSIINAAYDAAVKLDSLGFSAAVASMHTLKPYNNSVILDTITQYKKLVIVEEHNIIGGLYSSLAEVIISAGAGIPTLGIGLNDCFATGYGNIEELREMNNIGVDSIVKRINEWVR